MPSELSMGERADVARAPRRRLSPNAGTLGLWSMIGLTALIVLPPIVILFKTSVSIETDTLESTFGWDNFSSVIDIAGAEVWVNTLIFAAGSAFIGLVGGVSYAWIVARTNAYFRNV